MEGFPGCAEEGFSFPPLALILPFKQTSARAHFSASSSSSSWANSCENCGKKKKKPKPTAMMRTNAKRRTRSGSRFAPSLIKPGNSRSFSLCRLSRLHFSLSPSFFSKELNLRIIALRRRRLRKVRERVVQVRQDSQERGEEGMDRTKAVISTRLITTSVGEEESVLLAERERERDG